MPLFSNSVNVTLDVICLLDEDTSVPLQSEGRWSAFCPVLDVASQGSSELAAKENLEEAIALWVESCLERSTFERAMQELHFKRVQSHEIQPDDQVVGVSPAPPAYSARTFPLHVQVPAFQASAFLQATSH